MKKFTKGLVIAGAYAVSAVAQAHDFFDRFCPFVGIDYKHMWNDSPGQWKRYLPHSFPGWNAYVGAKFHENLGLEVGYSRSSEKEKTITLGRYDTFFGTSLFGTPGGYKFVTKNKFQGPYADLVAYLPLMDRQIDLMAFVGMSWLKPKVSITSIGNNSTAQPALALASVTGKSKAAARLGLGVQYFFTEFVGVRLKGAWEGTKRLRVNGDTNFVSQSAASGSNLTDSPFRNSLSVNVGAFVYF